MTVDIGMSSTMAQVGVWTSGNATARITNRVFGGESAPLPEGALYAMMPANPSHPTHLGSVAGGDRWPHDPATIGSVAGRLRGARTGFAAAGLHARSFTGMTASETNGYRVSVLAWRRSSASAI